MVPLPLQGSVGNENEESQGKVDKTYQELHHPSETAVEEDVEHPLILALRVIEWVAVNHLSYHLEFFNSYGWPTVDSDFPI